MHPYLRKELPRVELTPQFCHDVSEFAVNNSIFDDVIFGTVLGSFLYGTAHEGSDVDLFLVRETGRNKSSVVDNVDVQVLNLETFIRLLSTGCHQAVEAFYSPYKVFTDSPYVCFIKAQRPSPYNFIKKAQSAAKSLRGRSTPKGSLHARRLEYAADQTIEGNYTPIYKNLTEQTRLTTMNI